jgi:hypothetical protein
VSCSRIRLAALIALSAVATACGDSTNPLASFETRCAKLPPTHFEVVVVPLEFERGLTTAVFGQSTDIRLNVGGRRAGERKA